MKLSHICAVLVLLGVSTVEGIQIKNKVDATQAQKLFSSFVSKFQRNYRNNKEYETRLSNFIKNNELIETHNSHNEDFQLEANKFADLTEAEFSTMLGLKNIHIDESAHNAEAEAFVFQDNCNPDPTPTPTPDPTPTPVDPSAKVDWRTKGVVAPVKNQASCGSCYSFSALESLQAYYHIKKGAPASQSDVLNLSEQQVVDCSGSYGNQGCNGGLMSYTYNYLKVNSIMLDSDYGYTAKKGTCKYSSTKGKFKVTSYVNLPKNDPQALLEAVNKQPVSIAMRAGSSVVQLYKSGIISSTSCGTALDHAVVVVGYGSEGGKDYWIVKNSWGSSWGENGYFRVLRSTAKGAGICGILQLSSYPSGISI